MNKAITDGLVLMPPAFELGLGIWSSEDGTPGQATYAGSGDAALVPADQDFGSCLELTKQQSNTRLRYMGDTPLLPGCYLRVTARVKAMSGNLPAVRIAGWAGGAGGVHVAGLTETAPPVQLTAYGRVETVQAIIGTGWRTGVDMAWGSQAIYGHFGIDLTGPNGAVVRIDDLEIEDVTSVFLRNMMDWVDVRDYGARGDGVADDAAAFEAADAAAVGSGRAVLVSTGSYLLGADVTMAAPVRFEGSVIMPDDKRLSLTRAFDLPTYAAAFGSEELGFRKAFQALLNFSDHESLDLKGRRIEVSAPIDMQAAVANKTTFATRRVIRNGQFNVVDGPAWTPVVATSQASYSAGQPTTLTAVVNIANILPGSLVTGAGVGREIYVTAINVGAGTLTLSKPLYGAASTQGYTFTRFRYVLDFSGFAQLDKFNLDDVEIQCNGAASGVLLAPSGQNFQIRDCFVSQPRDRGITSMGTGCQGMEVNRCTFLSNEQSARAQDRSSVAFNANANDLKIRDSRFVRFRHTMILGGSGNLVSGNHWFQGDDEIQGLRLAGLVLVGTSVKSSVTGNYIDNSFVELTNEYEAQPDFNNQLSFGGLTLTGNVFTANDVAPWFSWIVVKPHGTGHFIQGLNVSGNVFKALNGNIDRIERVDRSIAGLDFARMRNVVFGANSFAAVTQPAVSPVLVEHETVTAATVWTVTEAAGWLPFGGWARNVAAIVTEGPISGPASERRTEMPYVEVEQGAGKQEVVLNWSQPASGRVLVTIRVDNPN